ARAFDKIPAKRSANYQFEIPATNSSPCFANEHDSFGAPGRVSFRDYDLIQVWANIRPGISLKRVCKLRSEDSIRPTVVRHPFTVNVSHAAKVFNSVRSP